MSIVQVVEQYDTYWTSIEDGDSLSYVPELHDHRPSPETSAVAEKVSQDFSGAACVDCTELLANGETPTELDEAETAAYLASVEATTAGYRVFLDCPEDCEGYFSWSSCDVCGSTLGGDRHPVMFFSVQS